MDFLVDRTYQREIKPVPTLSCGGAFRYRSGERLHGMQEVSGSIPLSSTKFLGSLSSRGLGHDPFTVGTGVRIPVGTPI